VSDVEIIEPQRGTRGRWLTSGNPGGLTHEHRDLLKHFRDKSADAANVLYDIMMDPKQGSSIRAFCAVHWLDRAFGKPKQTIDMAERGRTLEQILDAIALTREAEAREQVERKQGG
jgi:hypothetical protein